MFFPGKPAERCRDRNGPHRYDAIVLAHEWMSELVLMEIKMPEMTGLEATSRLTRELPDVIIILMPAFEDEKTLWASKESGAFAFVMKKNLTHDLPRLLAAWKRDGC